jgi:hypothetical protein
MTEPERRAVMPEEARAQRIKRLYHIASLASAIWAACICGIALYEYNAVDPWKFIGEDRAAMFFTWSRQLVYVI